MKRVITLGILFLFLLNAVGFYGIFLGVQFKIASEANRQFDEDQYTPSESISFQVPIAMPYSIEEQDFHRVTGEFEHQGEVYRLVKQKLHNDTLYIVCVKDTKSKKLNQALADYVKTFTDRPFSTKQQGTKLVYSIIKDYLNTGIAIESDAHGWKECVPYHQLESQYNSSYSARIKYPPKFSFLS
jgi:Txe/YoeB family toxin of Txe-Axe toxin-antitoxin module